MSDKLLIYNADFIDRDTCIKNGALLLADRVITGFVSAEEAEKLKADPSVNKYDAKGLTVMPSFVDMHAHFRDPGFTEKEDLESGCRAAAAGGFGTLVLMPNTNPVISSEDAALGNMIKAAVAKCARVYQAVSITKDFAGKDVSHLKELEPVNVPLISEDGKEVCDSAIMLEGMKIAKEKGIVVSCHCEDLFLAQAAKPLRFAALESLANGKREEAAALLKEANKLLKAAEESMTYRNILLAGIAGCHLHLCHVSTAECLTLIRRFKAEGMNLTFEVTPHHLGLSDEGDGIFKIVNPPLRSEEDRLALIEALKDGTADVIATDHAPHTAEDKAVGAPGFSGLETAFALCNTRLVKENAFTLQKLSSLMSARPAEILGLETGLLKKGYMADLVVVAPDEEWTVSGKDFKSKGKYTPLEGKTLTGRVKATIFNGYLVYQTM